MFIHVASKRSVISLLRFYWQIGQRTEIQRFYRFLSTRTLRGKLICIVFLLLTQFFPSIYKVWFGRSITFVYIKDNFSGNLIGVAHIDNIIRHKTGVVGVVVTPENRKSGLGAQLMRKVIMMGEAKCLESLILEVDFDNSIAISLYKKLGFVELSKISEIPIVRKSIEGFFMKLNLPVPSLDIL